MRKLEPVTPGEILSEEFLKPMGLERNRLAEETGVPVKRIDEIVAGRCAITADTDLRLCRFFGLSDGYWLRAQAAHDAEVAEGLISPKPKIRKLRSANPIRPTDPTSEPDPLNPSDKLTPLHF